MIPSPWASGLILSSFILPPSSPTDLRNELAALHFDAIKIRTFRGALARVLDPAQGLPSYLGEIRAAAGQFAAAASALSATEMARVAWPSLPTSVLIEEMQQWWDADRSAWSRRVHGFYRVIGQGIMWPVRAAWTRWPVPAKIRWRPFSGRSRRPWSWRSKNSSTSSLGSRRSATRFCSRGCSGSWAARPASELLARIEAAHRSLPPVDEDYRAMLRAELDAWKTDYPRVMRWIQTFDQALAVARPAITVTLCVSGGVLAGDLVGQAAMHAAGHVAGHVAADAAIATGITEAVVSTTGEGARQAAARLFRRLQTGLRRSGPNGWPTSWRSNCSANCSTNCGRGPQCRNRSNSRTWKPPWQS